MVYVNLYVGEIYGILTSYVTKHPHPHPTSGYISIETKHSNYGVNDSLLRANAQQLRRERKKDNNRREGKRNVKIIMEPE